MATSRWSRAGRPRAAARPVEAPARTERLLVDRGGLVVPIDDVRVGRATVGEVLRSLRSVGVDDVAVDVDEAAWRLQQALRSPASAVTPTLDALLWRVPRAGGRLASALVASLARGAWVASGWILGIVPILLLPGAARLVPLDADVALVPLVATGLAAMLLAVTRLLEVVEAAERGLRLPTSQLVLGIVAVGWGAGLPIGSLALVGPTWLSLHGWTVVPGVAALATLLAACALQDSLPGGARRRRAAPPQSMPRATARERHEALVRVASARLASLDAEQERRLDAAVDAAVRDLHVAGHLDDRTRDLLLAGTADEGYDPLPTVLLAVDAAAPVPLGSSVSANAVAAVLDGGDASAQLTTAVGLIGAAVPASAWTTGQTERVVQARHAAAMHDELDRHVDPIVVARTPVLEAAASAGARGALAVAWRALPWLASAGAVWAMLMALVVARAGADPRGGVTETTRWIMWGLLVAGLVGAVGWAAVLDVVERVQRDRTRVGLGIWQLVGIASTLAAVATLGGAGMGDASGVPRVLVLAALVAALVATTVRRVDWWRGRVPSRRVRGVGEWPLRLATAQRVDAHRRASAAERRAADPDAFDRTRARLAALALVPIARGTLDARALDGPAA